MEQEDSLGRRPPFPVQAQLRFKDFLEIALVPAGLKALAFYAAFVRGLAFEHVQRAAVFASMRSAHAMN